MNSQNNSRVTILIDNHEKKFVLNFWHALLLLLYPNVVYILLYVIFRLLFKTSHSNLLFQIYSDYVRILLYVPFIFCFAKKTDTNFKDSLFIPDLWTVIKMFVVVVLARTIVLSPIDRFDLFFESLKNSNLRIVGATMRPLMPFTDLGIILICPIIEELFFRGLILKNFLKKYSPVYAILLSSLLFGIYHLSFDNLISHVFVGILFGILYFKTNSLIIVVLAHMIWNTFSLLIYEFVELDLASSILNLFIYITAFIFLVYLLRKSIINDKSQSAD
jgi:membrane protease YdiL (CAAX protease family)